MKGKQSRGAFVALAVAMLVAPLAEAQTRVKSGFNMFSAQQDAEIGYRSAVEVEQKLPLVRSAEVQDFVSDLGQQLAAVAPGPRFQYRFRVIDDSDLNAFALPGGYIYLNRGILQAANNEGEVAGVLAHEIAHVALRHGTENASKAYLTQAGAGIVGRILSGKVSQNAGQLLNVVGGLGLNAVFLRYSRQAETEADILGAQILTRAGYNPQDQANFFETIARHDRRRTVNWLSSHPAPSRRIARIRQEAALLGVEPRTTQRTARLDRVQRILASR